MSTAVSSTRERRLSPSLLAMTSSILSGGSGFPACDQPVQAIVVDEVDRVSLSSSFG
jgi:hypothetical protein